MNCIARSVRPQGGFTLVEMLVAISLTGMVALLTTALLAGTLTAADALDRSATEAAGPIQARLWALEACHALETGVPGTRGFDGTVTQARFHARVLGATGRITRASIRFGASAGAIHIETPVFRGALTEGADTAAMDYLIDPAGDGSWVTAWFSPISAPLAIRFRWNRGAEGGSLICPIGARG